MADAARFVDINKAMSVNKANRCFNPAFHSVPCYPNLESLANFMPDIFDSLHMPSF